MISGCCPGALIFVKVVKVYNKVKERNKAKREERVRGGVYKIGVKGIMLDGWA